MSTTMEGIDARGYLIGWLKGVTSMFAADINAIPDDKWTGTFGGCTRPTNELTADAVSLIDPDRFYDDLLKPSLAALFVSQVVVFAVFPRYRRGSVAIGAAAAASALAIWGLYTLFAGGASS